MLDIKWEGANSTWSPGDETDEMWVTRLARELNERNQGEGYLALRESPLASDLDQDARVGLHTLWRYFIGRPPLPAGAENWHRRDAYEVLRICRANHAENVILSVADRVTPLGWRTGLDDDSDGDELAAEIATVNGLDGKFGEALMHMLVMADAYMIIGDTNDDGIPLITNEDPRLVISYEDVWGRTVKALRAVTNEWTGEPGYVLYGKGYYRESVRDPQSLTHRWLGEPRRTKGLDGDVQVVRMRNQASVGDYENHLDDIDRIHVGILSRVDIARFQAHRQRAIEDLPDFDEQGRKIEYAPNAFVAEPGAMWRLPSGAKIWESQPVDIGPIRLAVKDDVETFYTNTRTPLHYVSPEAAEGSAEGAGLQREAHVFRVEDRQRRGDRALAQVMSLAFKVMGEQDRAKAHLIRTMWAPTERYTLTERAAAGAQAKAQGFGFETIALDIWQYKPTDLPRLEAARGKDLLWDMSKAVTPPPTGTAQGVSAIQGALIGKGQMAPATTGTNAANAAAKQGTKTTTKTAAKPAAPRPASGNG